MASGHLSVSLDDGTPRPSWRTPDRSRLSGRLRKILFAWSILGLAAVSYVLVRNVDDSTLKGAYPSTSTARGGVQHQGIHQRGSGFRVDFRRGGSVRRRYGTAKVMRVQADMQASDDVVYKESLVDKAVLGLFRSLVARGTGYKSPLPGFEGLKDEAKQYMVTQRATPEMQQQMVVDVLNTMAGPFPAFYKAIMPKLPKELASFFTALFTPLVFGFLVGPSGLNTTRDGRPFQGVTVQKCRFLAETGCKGLCVNMCKIPTQRFFQDEMGFPMEMRPNFDTCQCTLSYGITPMPLEEDVDVPQACLVGCQNLLQMGEASTDTCGSAGAGDSKLSPAIVTGSKVDSVTTSQSVATMERISGDGENDFPDFIDKTLALEIQEGDCVDMLKSMRRVPVTVPFSDKPVLTTVAGMSTEEAKSLGKHDSTPLVLLHGFDSSLLEFRRLMPALKAYPNLNPNAIDLLGWGFAKAEGEADSIGPKEKREHLYHYWKQYVKEPMILCGASLGGAVGIDFALNHPEAVKGLVLIDAQAYIDGVQTPPEFFMDIGLNVLKSEPLRQIANVQSYYDKEKYATKDAMRIGKLHTVLEDWKDYNKKWMQGGGYILSSKIKDIQQKTLILWGDSDKILGTDVATQFEQDIPSSELVWVPECGHVPHLEQADFTAKKLNEFAMSL